MRLVLADLFTREPVANLREVFGDRLMPALLGFGALVVTGLVLLLLALAVGRRPPDARPDGVPAEAAMTLAAGLGAISAAVYLGLLLGGPR